MNAPDNPDGPTRDEAEAILRQLARAGVAAPPGPRAPSLPPAEAENGFLPVPGLRLGRERVEEELRLAEARYRTLVEQIPAVTFMASLAEGTRELYVSPQIEALLGFSQKEWLENPVLWYTQLHPDDRERWHQEFALTCSSGRHFRSEYRFLTRTGEVVWVHGEAQVVHDDRGQPLFLQGVAYDITTRKKAEEALRTAHDDLERQVLERTAELAQAARALEAQIAEHKRALEEKVLLLKEIHHRVKNNLQIVSSLLNLQAGQLTDPQALQALRDSQNRVRSMALIHEKLYRSRDLARIDLGQYLEELAASLFRSRGGTHRGIGLRVNAANAFFDIDTAIPCGLIVNELISNSLEHAFPGGATGTIAVELTPGPGPTWMLTVGDDGAGFPEGLDVRNSPSLGLQLVTTLADQLGGSLAFRGQGGAAVTLTFPVPAGGETTKP